MTTSISEVRKALLESILTKIQEPATTAQDLATLAGAVQTIAYVQEPRALRMPKKSKSR